MLISSHRGVVVIEYKGYWALMDDGGAEDPRVGDDPLGGSAGAVGAYFFSGRFTGPTDVTVQVHDGEPAPETGWQRSTEFTATYPSRVAAAFAVDRPDEPLAAIPLPARDVRVRAFVEGWKHFDEPGEEPDERWLLQVWPAG